MEKKAARAEIQRRLERVTARQRIEKSARAIERLLALDEYRAAHTVLLFASMPDELDTLPLIARALAAGKRVVLPRCEMETRRLLLCPISDLASDVEPGTYDILEPPGDVTLPPGELDFALIPARAYDERGNRLGRGAGFYDRLLSDPAFHATRCGLAYEEQVLPAVPHEAHDRPVEIVVTDQAVRRA